MNYVVFWTRGAALFRMRVFTSEEKAFAAFEEWCKEAYILFANMLVGRDLKRRTLTGTAGPDTIIAKGVEVES